MTRRVLGWIRVCILLCLTVAAASPAQSEPAETPFASISKNATSCFTGPWSSVESYVEHSLKRKPSLPQDEAAVAEGTEYYTDLMNYECKWFDYEVDGFIVRGFYAKPRRIAADKLPVIIFNRGGNADSGAIPPPYIFGKLFPVVKKGFVVVGSMYRGARLGSEPHPDRLADEFGGKDVNDILALLPIIETMPFADAEKIGMWGVSRGGIMTYLAVARSDRFRALVAEATPTDLKLEIEFRPEMEGVLSEWIPGYPQNREEALRERSVLAWAERLPETTAILILHGTADERVRANSALEMALKLQELGRPYRLVMFENGGHGLHRTHQDAVTLEVAGWFKSKLSDGAE